MLNTTVGQLLINDALPEELRDYSRELDKKSLNTLLEQVAKQYPDQYRDISHNLGTLGRKFAHEQGGFSFGISHLLKSKSAQTIHDEVQAKIQGILANPNLTPQQRRDQIVLTTGRESERLQKSVMQEALDGKNPLALQIVSGTRGKPMNLASLIGSDMLYADHRDRPIPIPVLRSYADGLSPAEYWAGTYGARKGVLATKLATANAGYFSKQLNAAMHRLLVTGEDDTEGAHDEMAPRGYPVDADDPDSEGALLAADTGPYKRNTLLTPKILRHLKRLGKNQFLVRSPTVGGAPDGGLYARDIGVREKGSLPGRGEIVGLTAAQAIGEPLSQGQLCLGKGTTVRMADGTVKAIEEIVIGDVVLGADLQGQTFPVAVVRTYINGVRECVRTSFWCAQRCESTDLVSTEDHKILGVKYWRNSRFTEGKLPLGDACDVFYARTPHTYFRRSTQDPIGPVETYDIEVDHPDHLFVLENGLIVSNSAKHSGGVAGQEKAVSGFDLLNQLVQVPKKMRGGAAHALADGKVDSIEEAPAGGYHVLISGKKHFVPPGRELRVKSGDTVEAGDLLSDGIPNPAMIVEHKGVGEGRRYFVNEFRKAMQEGGMPANRRNVELLARGLINHVQLTDEYDDYVPDDVIPYSTIEKNWKPREGYEELDPQNAVGKYLERPVLHHSIGTKIRPSMLQQFSQFGVQKLTVHKEPPPFQPHMVRAMYQMQADPDWMTQMYGSGLKKSLLNSVARGSTSDPAGTSFVPSLAMGKDFGSVPGRAVRSPSPGYAVPSVPLPDPNLLAYKEAIDGAGVDTTATAKISTPAPTKPPPATPANPLPSGTLASFSSPQLFPGANYLRQNGSGVGFRATAPKIWQPSELRSSTPGTPDPPRAGQQAQTGFDLARLQQQVSDTSGALSAAGAAGTTLSKQLVPNAVKNFTSRAAGSLGQVAKTTMPTLSKVAPKVVAPVTSKFGPSALRSTAAISAGLNSLNAANDIMEQGHMAAGDTQLKNLQNLTSNLLSGKVDWSTPGQIYNTVTNPVANVNAAGVGATHLVNELQNGAGSALRDVAASRMSNLLGAGTQIKDVEISPAQLNDARLPNRIANTISHLDKQIASATDLSQVQRLRDQRARYDILLKSYRQNAGVAGTGQFGTLFTGNLQNMKQRLSDVEQRLQDSTLDEAQRQDLLQQQSRLQNDIGTYRGWTS